MLPKTIFWILLVIFPCTVLAQLPEGFYVQIYARDFDQPMGITFDHTGRMLVWEKAGRVLIVDATGLRLPNPLIDLREEVSDWKDHGLMGFALDPNFENNGLFYLLYALDLHHYWHFGTPQYNPDTTITTQATIIGYFKMNKIMNNNSPIGKTLREAVNNAQARLRSISNEQSGKEPAPGKWSPKEILGHLIDSVSNNHQRFVRAQFQDHLIFPGYDQEGWVNVQHYKTSYWIDLIELWTRFNLHLAKVIDHVPDHIRHHPHEEHNLDHIAWKTIPEDQTATLEYFMADYVGHLNHHLEQIWEATGK